MLWRPSRGPEIDAMKNGVSTLERAFEIARSGNVRGIEELRTALRDEGYDQMSGRFYLFIPIRG